MHRRLAFVIIALFAHGSEKAVAGEPPMRGVALEHPGYKLLAEKPYLPADFDADIFDGLWRRWDKPRRERAEAASPEERRRLAFSYYGLTPRPDSRKDRKVEDDADPNLEQTPPMPLQFVQNKRGGWAINCFACHGGKVAGKVIPGLPNSHFAFQTLMEDVRAVRLARGEFNLRDAGWSVFPLGGSNGTTNAVMFGVAVLVPRDKDLNVSPTLSFPHFIHHDMDAPPWWNVKKKKWLYCDGSVERDHRALMPFVLSARSNSGERVRGWEDDFKQMYEWMLSLEPPQYPYEIDQPLAEKGRVAFNGHCAGCHGTYGPDGEYPEKLIPIDEVGTDRARLDALRPEHHRKYAETWLSHYGKKKVRERPGGYVAPPLDGVWASAPYLHNGSVPTLWHMLHPDVRPVVWQRSEDGYDRRRVGLEIEELDAPPDGVSAAEKRRDFNTRLFGKSAVGHEFPNELSADEKRAVLEYLKTL